MTDQTPGGGAADESEDSSVWPRPVIGRPTKYRPEYAQQARNYCELGATDADLARFFGISRWTIYHWQAMHPEFAEALKLGKLGPDARVERSLYQRAVGYDIESEQIFYDKDTGKPVRAQTVEHIPADPASAIFWLKNRCGWRDRKELTGPDGEPLYTQPPIIQLVAYEEDKESETADGARRTAPDR